MKIFGRTPGEYLRFAAVPLAVFAVFLIFRVDLYRRSWLRPDGDWALFAFQVTVLFLVVRVRWTRFGNFLTLLPLFAMATAVLGIVDSLSLMVGRLAPDNRLASADVGPILIAVMMTMVLLLYWVLGSVLLGVLMAPVRLLMAALVFAPLFFAALVPQLGVGIPLVVMGLAGFGFLVRLVLPKTAKAAAWLAYAGSVCLIAFAATLVGGTTSCNLQHGDQATAEQIVASIETYRQAHTHYPESLQALPTLPPLRFGQTRLPYYYGFRGEDSFDLMYPTGFRMGRIYRSTRKQWEAFD